MITTIEKIKVQLGIMDNSQDVLLQQLLDQANSYIEKYCGRKFSVQDYSELYDGNGQYSIELKNFPVNTLTSLKKNTGTITSPVWESFDEDTFVVKKETGIVKSVNFFPYGLENIQVIYNAGYSTEDMPQDLENACISLVGYYYNTKNSQGVASESVDGASIRYSNEAVSSTIPSEIQQTLNLYKVVYV